MNSVSVSVQVSVSVSVQVSVSVSVRLFTDSKFIGEMRHSLFLMIYDNITFLSCFISQ